MQGNALKLPSRFGVCPVGRRAQFSRSRTMVSRVRILRRSLNSFHVAAAVCVLTLPAGTAQSQTPRAPTNPQQAEAQQAKQRVSRDARQEAREKLEETIAGRNDSSSDLRAPDLGVW